MRGSSPLKPGSPSRSFSKGRVCRAPGCSTRLSVYNEGDRCWQHADVVFPNFRGKRLSKSGV